MTKEEVIAVTGPIADRFIIQILEVGGHYAHLVEAASWVRGDSPDFVAGQRYTSAIVTRLSEIIPAADAAVKDPLEWEGELR